MSKKKKKNKKDTPGYQQPPPPTTDEQLINQLKIVKGFVEGAAKCVANREHCTAYTLTDRSAELLIQIRTAMEDLPPT